MDVKLPKLGEGADSGVVVGLFVKEGDTVAKDQPIMELENEKAVASIPSTGAGVVEKIHVKNGDRIGVGQKIITIADGAAPAAAAPVAAAAPATKPAAKKTVAKAAPIVEAADDEPVAESADEIVNENPSASPSVRKAAREFGIDLRKIHGSESGGRITGGDVKNYIARLIRAAARPATVVVEAAPAKAAPMSSENPPPAASTLASASTSQW